MTVWTLRWTDTRTGETALCEVENGHAYECYHNKANAQTIADETNALAVKYGWSSTYDVVELPGGYTVHCLDTPANALERNI